MKKVLSLLLALALAFALCACGNANTPQDSDDTPDDTPEKVQLKILDTEYAVEDYAICVAKENTDLLEKVDAALKELKDDGTLQKIVDKYISGVEHDLVFQADAEGKDELHMATEATFPPYEFYDGDDIVGIDAEVAAAIADKLDMKLVIDDMAFNTIIVAVQTGKADMGMAGMTVTDERKDEVNFTSSYATGVQVVIVPEDSPITSVDDLFAEGANYNIGVQTQTTGDLYTTGDLEDVGLATVQRYNNGADAIAALVAGKIDCVVIDNEPAKAFVASNNG